MTSIADLVAANSERYGKSCGTLLANSGQPCAFLLSLTESLAVWSTAMEINSDAAVYLFLLS